ncbi:hypothetical protein OH76DRAFT_464553 [Lentinus brumalis]|uniref:Uncharacterized protein n=1 Tax=Lentinus brumalis TaxID=2498619 RepID=A0A371DCH8_9APHY|nr:hypothetical protein OH76DRAFT_464553 [Polyporus brumalis]
MRETRRGCPLRRLRGLAYACLQCPPPLRHANVPHRYASFALFSCTLCPRWCGSSTSLNHFLTRPPRRYSPTDEQVLTYHRISCSSPPVIITDVVHILRTVELVAPTRLKDLSQAMRCPDVAQPRRSHNFG